MASQGRFVPALSALLFIAVATVSLVGSQAFEFIQGPDTEAFMAAAKIVRTTSDLVGVAAPRQVLLELDGVTRFGVFKTIDEKRIGLSEFDRGPAEMNFQDSWQTEVAAYELDKLIELGMVPVTVERAYQGQRGSLQAWAPVAMSESERVQNKIRAPDVLSWNEQIHKVRIFDNLIYNTDRHLRNLVITEDWKVVLIDHSRSFRPSKSLRAEEDLTRFSRSLLESFGRLDREILEARLGRYLNRGQISGILGRKDLIIERAERLASERGADAVWLP